MIFDLLKKDHQVTLLEQPGEDILRIKDKTHFTLCERIRDGKYEIPFIALGIVVGACKKLGYRMQFTPELKAFYEAYVSKRKMLEDIKALDENIPIAIPEISQIGLKAGTVLTFGQKATVKFALEGKTILCGSEVGTGKSLAFNIASKILILQKKVNKVIVVTQSSLVQNWYGDYVKFFSDRGIIRVSKSDSKKKREEIYRMFMSRPDLNYLVLNFEKYNFDFDFLATIKCDCLIVDEAHNFKNYAGAKRSENFFKLLQIHNPKYRYALTGTAIENRIGDIFSIFKYLDGGKIVGSHTWFDNNFVSYRDEYFKIKLNNGRTMTRMERKPIGFKNHEFLKNLIRPSIIRVKSKLPVGLYEEFITLTMPKKMKDKHEEIRHSKEHTSKKYHQLRQFLNAPSRENITDDLKLDRLVEMLDQTSEKFLIFSFYKCSLDSISRKLSSLNIPHLTFSGEDTKITPSEIISKFENEDYRVLIATDRLSTGVNMQFCRYGLNWEVPIKPSVGIQRAGRLFRLGQKNDVHFYNFIYDDSIESTIYEQFNIKREVIREVIENLDDNKLQKINKEIEQKIVQYLSPKI